MIRRVAIVVGLIALVFASLMTFPAHLHWMASVWLVIALMAFAKHQPMWPWLAGCVLILAIKRPGFAAEFWLLVTVYIVVAIVDWTTPRIRSRSLSAARFAIFALVLIGATTTYGIARWFSASLSRTLVLDERPIACLGDSLSDSGYPQELEKLITVPVADFGVSGIRTDDGISMIPDILAVQPQLVVIELGGHDYNAGNARSATRSNLATLIEAFLGQGIAVILVELPRGFVCDPYDGLERDLAARYDLQLIDDTVIRSFEFNSPLLPPGMWLDPSRRYSDDGLHPNDLGNRHFARIVSQSLVEVYGRSILK